MRDLYLEKKKLFKESNTLNTLSKEDGKNSFKIKELQDKKYKEYVFFKEFIKEMEKRK
jgi:hypothetical protein